MDKSLLHAYYLVIICSYIRKLVNAESFVTLESIQNLLVTYWKYTSCERNNKVVVLIKYNNKLEINEYKTLEYALN